MLSFLSDPELWEKRRISWLCCAMAPSPRTKSTPELLKEMQQNLQERFTFDVQLGTYTEDGNGMEQELQALGVDELALVESFLKHNYETLDFKSMIDQDGFTFGIGNYSNYIVKVTAWDGTGLGELSSGKEGSTIEDHQKAARVCAELLHKKCVGTLVQQSGYSTFNNYVGIFRQKNSHGEPDGTWMEIQYFLDNASCGGFIFALISKSCSSLAALWSGTKPEVRMRILPTNLTPSTEEDWNYNMDSDSSDSEV